MSDEERPDGAGLGSDEQSSRTDTAEQKNERDERRGRKPANETRLHDDPVALIDLLLAPPQSRSATKWAAREVVLDVPDPLPRRSRPDPNPVVMDEEPPAAPPAKEEQPKEPEPVATPQPEPEPQPMTVDDVREAAPTPVEEPSPLPTRETAAESTPLPASEPAPAPVAQEPARVHAPEPVPTWVAAHAPKREEPIPTPVSAPQPIETPAPTRTPVEPVKQIPPPEPPRPRAPEPVAPPAPAVPPEAAPPPRATKPVAPKAVQEAAAVAVARARAPEPAAPRDPVRIPAQVDARPAPETPSPSAAPANGTNGHVADLTPPTPVPAAPATSEGQRLTLPPLLKNRKVRGWMQWFVGKEEHEPQPITQVPAVPEHSTEVHRWEFQRDTTYARVILDHERGRHRYEAIEPKLDPEETRALAFVKEVLVRTLDVELKVIDRNVPAETVAALRTRTEKVLKDYGIRLHPSGVKRLHYYLERDFVGYGPIDVMMHDPEIEDISCDGAATPIYLYHRKYGSLETSVQFQSAAELDSFVIRVAQRSGKQITIADPLLDSSLPDGSRLQATLGREVTDNGSTFTIRRFRENPYSPIDLVRMGTMNSQLLAYCWLVVQYGANVMLAGGTASGKTTTLNTVSLFIPPQSKIVSIEDTREINLPHANWVRSVTRGGMRANDAKRVDMFDLLTAALRQRPEYILVGEVRGKEATVAFQAMATGHTVLGTIHADSPRSVVYRLESEPINIPRIVIQGLDVIMMQALLNVNGRRQRRISQVAEIVGIDPYSKEMLTNDAFVRDPATDKLRYSGRSYKLERIAQRNNWTAAQLEREFRRRTHIIDRLLAGREVSFKDVARILSMYETRPEAVDAEIDRLTGTVSYVEAGP